MPHQRRTPQVPRLPDGQCNLGSVRRCLAAGGLPNAVVTLSCKGHAVQAPILFAAIANHHCPQAAESIQLLVDAGADVEAIFTDHTGCDHSALMLAAMAECCSEALRILLQRGARPGRQVRGGRSALHAAAETGSVENCKLLIAAGGRVLQQLRDGNGRLPVFSAVFGGLPVVKLLHEEYGSDIRCTDRVGNTLLHACGSVDSMLVLAYLLGRGLDANAVNGTQHATPLYMMASSGYSAGVQLMLQHGADPTVQVNGKTALFEACSKGHCHVVDVLLDSGMQMEARNSVIGRPTVLAFAVITGQVAVVRLLIQRDADISARSCGSTVLHLAVCGGVPAMVSLLLEAGAAVQVHMPSDEGMLPLTSAVMAERVECAQLLIAAGADVSALHGGSIPLLHFAAGNCKAPALLQLLLQHGAAHLLHSAANMCRCCGKGTAVMLARQPAVLKALLAAGGDVHYVNDRGNTCLHRAAAHKYPAPVLCLLIKAGADLQAVNALGKTAAQVAADSGNTLAAALLIRAAAGP
jgi:ankyrin repeat protein